MENALLVIEKKDEIFFENKGEQVTLRRKRRKRSRRALSFAVLVFALIISALAYSNHEKIVEFILSHSLPKSEESPSILEPTTNNSENVFEEAPEKTDDEEISISPSNTLFPTECILVNESSHNLNFSELNYNFLSASEIYEAYGENAPLVLLTCFSPTESYLSNSNGSYHNNEYNVRDLAELIVDNLKLYGINALTVILPTSNEPLYAQKGAYTQAISETLTSNPSISYIFDISRNVLFDNRQGLYKESTSTSLVPTITFTYGTNSNGLTEGDKKSIAFGAGLVNHLNKSEIFVSHETVSKYDLFYNFQIPFVRVDIGSAADTYENAVKSAAFFSSGLSEYIK